MIKKTTSLIMKIIPELSDDDYFVNKKDSLVYSYLMNQNVKNFDYSNIYKFFY
jgi:hypothetical protein